MRFPLPLLTLLMAGPLAAQPAPDTLAVVGEAVLYADAYERSLAHHLTRTGRADTRAVRRAHLADLVDAYLLAAEAERRRVETPGLQRMLDLERRRLARDFYFEHALIDSLEVPTDADLRRAYARNQQQVVARHLFFRTREEAAAAYARLEAGTPFLVLAQVIFGAPGDSTAGLLGPLGYFGDVDPAVAEGLFALPEGGYSEPVRSRAGWHILKAERWMTNAILAEDDYQRRRASIDGLLRERRRLVAGDAFVQAQMEALDVQVDAAHVGALAAMLEDEAEQEPPEAFAPEDADALRAAVRPDAALATYTDREGRRRTFTVADYASWLPDLPPQEARHQTAASVGRALRNEVLGQRGLAAGLDTIPAARRRMAHQSRLHRATALRALLRDTSATPPPEETLRALAERRGLLERRERLDANFWHVPFATREEAEAARRAVLAAPRAAAALDGYVAHEGAAAEDVPLLRTHLPRVPVGEPVVVGLQDGRWALVQVERREAVTTPFEDLRPVLERALTPYAAEVRLLERLREGGVEVHEEVFERLLRAPEAPQLP